MIDVMKIADVTSWTFITGSLSLMTVMAASQSTVAGICMGLVTMAAFFALLGAWLHPREEPMLLTFAANWYINHHECPTCEHVWLNEWDQPVADRCPECSEMVEPTSFSKIKVLP